MHMKFLVQIEIGMQIKILVQMFKINMQLFM